MPLQDVLFAYGVEFPCGGIGECTGCRVRVLKGEIPVTLRQEGQLSPEQLSAGWRLACCSTAETDLTLEVMQWEAQVLTDASSFPFNPREGLGIAIDLGTTTLALQLLDLRTADVLGVETGLNEQAKFGADVMSRIQHAVTEGKSDEIRQVIRSQLGAMMRRLIESAHVDPGRVREVVIVGNTAMHHFFSGLDVGQLSHYPFTPVDPAGRSFEAADLGWTAVPEAHIRFGPCIGGFVGSDILAGVRATRLQESSDLVGLIDLGTNGEIVLGNRNRLVCCSTAAGPAFEASSLSMGMRAVTGAITQVRAQGGGFACHVAGGGDPRGICGSGIVDAIAAGLELRVIGLTGRIGVPTVTLMGPVRITQGDIREIQVAKAAIAAGVRILLDTLGASLDDVRTVHLAGAFGNYVNRESAHRIGLLPIPPERVRSAGNTALLGAKLALFDPDESVDHELVRHIQHVPLNAHPRFQDVFVDEMMFPGE